MSLRTVWREVIAYRRQLHSETGEASIELRPAGEWHRWLDDLHAGVLHVRAAVERPGSTVDPRAALIDLLATASAWVDAMDAAPPANLQEK